MLHSARKSEEQGQPPIALLRGLRWLLLGAAVLFFLLHYVHLGADFPNDSPWMDWSKYTDEGWYSDAATRHFLLGHWYLPGDFNPAVALPVWPLLEGLVFHVTGVSLVAARALAVTSFLVLLLALFALMERFPLAEKRPGEPALAAPLTMLFLCASPFLFVFERMAILEPPLAMLTVLSLLVASYLEPWQQRHAGQHGLFRVLWPQLALGLLLPAMVLTKTTALALFPAIGSMVWHRAGYRLKPALAIVTLPVAMFCLLWAGYLLVLVRPHYWADYQYLFSANAYTGFQLQPLSTVLSNTFADGQWMGGVLYPAFYVVLVLALFARPLFFRNPVVPPMLLWTGGYFFFLAYHNNLQPRYYVLLAVPITVLVAFGLEEFRLTLRRFRKRALRVVNTLALAVVFLAILIPDVLLQLSFVLHPQYTYRAAAQAVARIIRADPHRSRLLLSVSGSDLTLMTGLPSIDDDFGTMDLDERVKQYRPGWYVAWNDIDDDKMDALSPLYHPVRVAAFPALDDPDRDQLILYRLDPATAARPHRRHHQGPPRPLRTRLGQQPTTIQLQH